MGKTAVVAVLTLFGSGCCFQGASEPTGTSGGASATTGGTPGTSGAGGGTGGSGTTASGATAGSASASGTSGGACEMGALVLSPNPVNFGSLASTQSVSAFNIGTSPISIVGVVVSNGGSTFTVSGLPTLPSSLPAGQSLTFTVAYAPSGSADSGQLVATWSSGAACAPQTASATLLGNPGVGPCSLTVSPAQVTFGDVAAGTTASQVVTLTDVSEVACEISQVAIGGDSAFALATGQPTSFSIAPGAGATIGVVFSPLDDTPPLLRKGTLTFDTTDPTQGAVSVPLAGYLASVGGFFQGWFKWHGDPQNTGYSVVDTSALVGTVAWQLPIGEPDAGQTYVNSPVIDVSGNVYQMNGEGLLYAVALGGAVRWTLQLNPPGVDTQSATPVILSDGSLHVASGSAALGPNVFWVEPDGSELSSMGWGPPGFESCPNVDSSNDVFLAQQSAGATEPTAYAFSPFDGGLVIAGAVPLPVHAPSGRTGIAVAYDGTTYWANGGQVFALAPVGTPFGPLPAWPDGGVTIAAGATDPEIVGAVNSDLALDLETNDTLYAYAAWEDLGAAGDYAVQGVLAALDPSSGATKWTVPLPPTALPSGWTPLESDDGNAAPAIAPDGTVYVGNGDGLRAIDGASGAVKWLFASPNVSSSPAIGGDGTIFYGADDGQLYAVTPSGALRFAIPTGGPISSSPAIGGNGTVVFASDDGNLYAVQ